MTAAFKISMTYSLKGIVTLNKIQIILLSKFRDSRKSLKPGSRVFRVFCQLPCFLFLITIVNNGVERSIGVIRAYSIRLQLPLIT